MHPMDSIGNVNLILINAGMCVIEYRIRIENEIQMMEYRAHALIEQKHHKQNTVNCAHFMILFINIIIPLVLYRSWGIETIPTAFIRRFTLTHALQRNARTFVRSLVHYSDCLLSDVLSTMSSVSIWILYHLPGCNSITEQKETTFWVLNVASMGVV